MATKRYYWLKLKEDFFREKEIKKLRRIAGGDTYTIIYLKMMLLSLNDEGVLYYQGIEDEFYKELALELDEDEDNVKFTILYLMQVGLLEEINPSEVFLTRIPEAIGSETTKAPLMRKNREMKKLAKEQELEIPKLEPKTNAERQKEYKAKQYCKKQRHVPLIEDHMNKERYNGNYYTVLKRDNCQCAICGSTENLCVHHIDGYDEFRPQNSNENKMITLCRTCHRNVHESNTMIPSEILSHIGYFDAIERGNESNRVTDVLPPVTFCYTEIEREKEIEKRDRDRLTHFDKQNGYVDADATTQHEQPQKERIAYKKIQEAYNATCTDLPTCRSLSEARKKAIAARYHSGYSFDDFVTLFKKAQASSFLRGKNNRNWQANFDWLIKDANMAKVLDGNYDDHDAPSYKKSDLDDLF